jgi:hypothetical protein
MSDIIPPEIQAWIDKDTLYLETCSLEKFQQYKSWFYGPDHDIQPQWFVAIDTVIQNLQGTKV